MFLLLPLFSLSLALKNIMSLQKLKKKKCGHLLILSNIFFILFIMSNLIYLFLNFISWYLIFISSLVLIFLFFFLYFSWFFFIFIHLNLISFSCYKIFNPYSFQFYFFLFLIIFCFFLVLLFINWLIGNLASRFFGFASYGSIQPHDSCHVFKRLDQIVFGLSLSFFLN